MGEPLVRILERYAMYESFASGGMAAVHFGRVLGALDVSRPVAIKKLHPQLAADPEFVGRFLDEARLASRVRHPNVVQTLDAVASQGELFVVLEYVHGASLAQLVKAASAPAPASVAAAILFDVLEGLHAAHEARDAEGERLEIVHRDVSPQNVLVGLDGRARVLDFGVAKARVRSHVTSDGALRGKLGYMAPEQIRGDARPASDVFAAAVVLWELLTGRRLFEGDDEGAVLGKVLFEPIADPTAHVPELPPALAATVMRGLARDRTERFASAREMAEALQASVKVATPIEVGAWAAALVDPSVAERAARLAEIEKEPVSQRSPAPSAPRAPPPREGPRDPDATLPESFAAVAATVATPPAPHGRRRTAWALLGALALSAGLAAAAFGRPSAPATPTTSGAPPSGAAAAPAPGSTERAATIAPGASSAAMPAPPSEPAAAGSAPAVTPAASASAPAVTPASSAPVRPKSAPAATRASCTPPYTTDARGLRKYKPECFR